MNNKFESHEEEIEKFNNEADFWWDENQGPFKILHKINPLRLNFITSNAEKFFDIRHSELEILDIGSGGGILSEALQANFLNSKIIGVEPGLKNVETARKHCENNEKKPEYIHDKFEEYALRNQEKKFDIICAIEVIEHVEDWRNFLNLIDSSLKPGGLFFLSTLNRNLKSYLLGILAAEYILRFVPKKTHSWSKFLKPSEIILNLNREEKKYEIIKMSGIEYNLFKNSWSLSDNLDVNYILCLRKK